MLDRCSHIKIREDLLNSLVYKCDSVFYIVMWCVVVYRFSWTGRQPFCALALFWTSYLPVTKWTALAITINDIAMKHFLV